MGEMAFGRLKLSEPSKRLLIEIDEYIRRYDLRGDALQSAAPDVLDGGPVKGELDELVRKRLLRFDGKPEEADELCGARWDYWTARLTSTAIGRWWPDRALITKITGDSNG